MAQSQTRSKLSTLALSTAMASMAITGCTTHSAAPAAVSANKAATALSKGKESKAIEHAEAAVLASPHDASYRAVLGASYMESGRFQSASSAFGDALTLGDNSGRTALSYALAQVASGNNPAAVAVLDEYASQIDASDLGLAFALAGHPRQGVEVLENAIRAGNNTAKTRQNLAYSYALNGDWRSARLMAAQDVPAGMINHRIGEWAETVSPGQHQQRVAALLQVPVVADPGMPAHLALDNISTPQQLAVEAAAQVPVGSELPPVNAPAVASVDPTRELAPVAPVAPAASPQRELEAADFAAAFEQAPPTGTSFAEVAQRTMEFVSQPVVQSVAQDHATPNRATPRSRVDKPRGNSASATNDGSTGFIQGGSHLVQLGSFSSRARAERAWEIYQSRYPELANREMVITQARVRGKTYFRVSAGGYDARSASSMCSTVKAGGKGCIAWAESRPLPGAIDTPVRMARRED